MHVTEICDQCGSETAKGLVFVKVSGGGKNICKNCASLLTKAIGDAL